MSLYVQQSNWLRLTADKYPQPYTAYSALRAPQLPLWLEIAGAISDHEKLLVGSASVSSSGSGMTSAPRRLAECRVASIQDFEQDEWIHIYQIFAEAVCSPIIDIDAFICDRTFISGSVGDDLSPSPSLMFDNMGGGCHDHLDLD